MSEGVKVAKAMVEMIKKWDSIPSSELEIKVKAREIAEAINSVLPVEKKYENLSVLINKIIELMKN